MLMIKNQTIQIKIINKRKQNIRKKKMKLRSWINKKKLMKTKLIAKKMKNKINRIMNINKMFRMNKD